MNLKGFSPVKLAKHASPKWEYLVLDDLITELQVGLTIQEVLNGYGQLGWVLISVVPMAGSAQRGIFKRPL